MAKSTTGGLSGVSKAAAPVTIAQIAQSAVGPSKPAVTPVSAPVTLAQVGQPNVGPAAPANLPTTPIANVGSSKLQQVSAYNAPAGSVINTSAVNTVLSKNFDKGDPNLVTGEQLKSAEKKGQIDPSLGNLLSSNAAVAKGAAALGVTKNVSTNQLGGGQTTNYKGDLNAAAKAVGLDPANFTKVTTGAMGRKETTVDQAALYNAINAKANQAGLYAITERDPGATGSAKNAVHTTTLYSDKNGTLQPVIGQNGKPVTSTFKADTFVHDTGFFEGLVQGITGIASDMSPILIAMGAANGLNYILDGISNAGVGASTLDAASKTTGQIATDIAKDLGSTIVRSAIADRFGPVAGNVAGVGMNVAGVTGSPFNKGLASTLDVGTNINDITQEDTFGPAQGSTSYVDEDGNVIYENAGATNVSTGASGFPVMETDAINVSTGASGFPLSTDILNNAATSSTPNGDGTTTYNFSDGSSITTDNSGRVINTVDSTGTVVGGSSGDAGYTGDLTGGGTSGSGTNSGGTTNGVTSGTNAGTSSTDWAKVIDAANRYSTAGSAAQAAAAIYAANKQAEAAKYAQDLQQKRFDLINKQFAPQRGAGYESLNQIRSMLPGEYQLYDENGNPIGKATGTDYLTHQFTPQDLYAGLAPNYNFMLGQGQNIAQRQANLAGGGMGGNAQRALQEYTQNYAGNAYQNAFQNYQNQRTNIYNTLAGIAGIGQTANQATATAGQNATNAISQLAVGGAGAQAAGITGAANAIAGGLQNYGANQILQEVLNQNQNVAQNNSTATPPFKPA